MQARNAASVLPKPTAHSPRRIEGWSVLVDDRLLEPQHEAIADRALQFLRARLADIAAVVSPGPLERLRAVKIVLVNPPSPPEFRVSRGLMGGFGMAVNPDFGTIYVTGAAAAQQLGLDEDARRWVTFLRERTVFNSLTAVRGRLAPARTAAHREQMDQVVSLLAAAGLA